ncbi:MAG: S41 family peptidase, partial [Clostridia bacterium]
GDKWSYYLSAEEYQEYIEDNNANLVGIGVSVVYSASEQAMLVTGVYDDSPASEAGIQKLDYIVSVDLQDVAEIGYTESLNLVSGEKGSMVEIEIVRDGINQFLTVQRDEVTKVSVTYEMIDDNIAYIKISHFETETANQFTELVNLALEEGAEAFVFDVRNNTGGYLTKLVECLDILLPEGNVISTVSKAGNEEVYTSDSEMLDMPITVLVNASSYSAAEFFAAAIQDYGVGTIVGQATTGKGYTQSPVQMSDGSAIILSTNKYYTPNGNNLADIGVIPDIEIELTDEQTANFFFLTSDTDPQIKAAVEQVTMELLK